MDKTAKKAISIIMDMETLLVIQFLLASTILSFRGNIVTFFLLLVKFDLYRRFEFILTEKLGNKYASFLMMIVFLKILVVFVYRFGILDISRFKMLS